MRVEAEGKELILQNKSGDYVIIPVKYRQEVLGMIKDGCHQCIDDLVATLPTSKDYAEDGTVISPEDPPKTVNIGEVTISADEIKNKNLYTDPIKYQEALEKYNQYLKEKDKYDRHLNLYKNFKNIVKEQSEFFKPTEDSLRKFVASKPFKDQYKRYYESNKNQKHMAFDEFAQDYINKKLVYDEGSHVEDLRNQIENDIKISNEQVKQNGRVLYQTYSYHLQSNLNLSNEDIAKKLANYDNQYTSREQLDDKTVVENKEIYDNNYKKILDNLNRYRRINSDIKSLGFIPDIISLQGKKDKQGKSYISHDYLVPIYDEPIPIDEIPKPYLYNEEIETIAKKQKAIGVEIDGLWGPQSEKAWKEYTSKKRTESTSKVRNVSVEKPKQEPPKSRVYQLPWMDESQRYRFADDKGKVKMVSKQEYDKLKQKYPETEEGFEQRAIATTDRYRNLNWVQRGLKPNKYPVINNPDGSVSTHKLEYVEADGKFYVYPTIIQDEKGKLIELNSKDAGDYAFKTKTAIPFKTEAEAEYYSRNGLIKH